MVAAVVVIAGVVHGGGALEFELEAALEHVLMLEAAPEHVLMMMMLMVYYVLRPASLLLVALELLLEPALVHDRALVLELLDVPKRLLELQLVFVRG